MSVTSSDTLNASETQSVVKPTYDYDNWLVSATRALATYVTDQFDPNIYSVEMSFPDTPNMDRKNPLEKVLIHFEQDHIDNPVLGFGTPGVEVRDDLAGTWELQEAQVHHINFDVGIWVPAGLGGATTRMVASQRLVDLFARPEGKRAMMDATNGLWVISFSGGRNELDRINDVPVWRALDMTLVIRVVSRHLPAAAEVLPDGYDQDPELSITNDAGDNSPVT